MKTITVANHKGGCGKTTTALNLAVALAAKGARVLAVDLDFQGNLSDSMGCDLRELVNSRRTVHRLLLDPAADYSQYIEQVRPRLDLLPAALDTDAGTLLDALGVFRELRLKNKLQPAQKHYDYCIVDTPPALNTPTLNGLVAADLVIIPVETSRFALVGLTQLLATVHEVRQAHAPGQHVMALSTIHSARQVFDREVRAQVFDIFTEDFVFQSMIPRHVAVGEATADRKAVIEVNTASPATMAFHQLVKEVRELLGDDQEEATRKSQRVTK
jgi:chromosome partitioning protein